MRERALFTKLCPNCEGEINDIRLSLKNPCSTCLETAVVENTYEQLVEAIYRALKEGDKLRKYQMIHDVIHHLTEFNEFFERAVGSRLWSAQRTWAKRVFLGRSFSIVAPTGIGKTAFGSVMGIYLAKHGEKAYFIQPTTTLLMQTAERLRDYAKRAGVDVRIVEIHGKMKKGEKEEAQRAIEAGEFDILVTTSQYLTRNFDTLARHRFDFIFVDDVDAFLRASKNIDRVLQLLGFTEEIISAAYELIRAKFTLLFRSNDQQLRKRIEELQEKIDRFKENNRVGQLIVASATGRARGIRVKLFRELLDFEIGSTRANLRNIINAYTEERNWKEQVLSAVTALGKGGLVFVPTDRGREFAEQVAQYLQSSGVKAMLATSENADQVLKALEAGDVDVAVGVAAYYGVLVRGIDLPEQIRYTIFVGVPKFKFSLRFDNAPPGRLAYLLDVVADYDEDIAREARSLANRIRRNPRDEDVERAKEILRRAFENRELVERIKQSKEIAVVEENGELKILIADVRTYIQATGRTSRMYAGGITPGFSLVLVDDERVFDQLRRYMRIVLDEEFKPLEEIDLAEIRRWLEEGRRKREKLAEDPVKTVLFIVESPNKARTIAHFFGTPSSYRIGNIRGYEVATGKYILNIVATRGHMFDLVTDRGFHGVLVEEDAHWFVPVYTTIKLCRRCGVQTVEDKCPVCGSDEYLDDAIWRVNALRLFALESDFVIIGTDPDREGEKIAWDTALAISPYVPTIVRAEFHEVTRSAILRALEETRNIDENIVNAQIVRRVEDRWIGFELSRKLWEAFGIKILSAGRVQTPVLGWIIRRYEEHKDSVRIFLDVKTETGRVVFETPFKSVKELRSAEIPSTLEVRVEKREETELGAPAPFTTDTMLREAGERMGIGAKDIMQLAQDLFEAGLITYHRTDSTHVSAAGRALAREYISERFGEEYYRGRSWGEEGAHECIRPTKPLDTDTLIRMVREGEINVQGLRKKHHRLYSIIFERFMASQMRNPTVERAEVVYRLGEFEKRETAITRIVKDGWNLVRPVRTREVREGAFRVVEIRNFKAATVPLYTQADVVALMKERGIGRPSTYATIIQKLLDRKYVRESQQKKRLYPTQLGIRVYNFLSENYEDLVSEERTRILEETLDAIAAGERDYQDALREMYLEIRGAVGE